MSQLQTQYKIHFLMFLISSSIIIFLLINNYSLSTGRHKSDNYYVLINGIEDVSEALNLCWRIYELDKNPIHLITLSISRDSQFTPNQILHAIQTVDNNENKFRTKSFLSGFKIIQLSHFPIKPPESVEIQLKHIEYARINWNFAILHMDLRQFYFWILIFMYNIQLRNYLK